MRATMIGWWLVACRGPSMVEVPGSAMPGPARSDEPAWSWPAELPSLAGCTWSETSEDDGEPDSDSWTYDARGRLASHTRIAGGYATVSTHDWRGGCLLGTSVASEWIDPSVESGGLDMPQDGLVTTVHRFTCDPRQHKLSWEQLGGRDGSLAPLAGQSRTFVNSYDAIGQLATVETRGIDGDPGTPTTLDTWTWNMDGLPLVQVREARLEGSRTTFTWWWDHDLLLGRDEEGTGADSYSDRVYEDRRLIEETTRSDNFGTRVTRWEYADDRSGFPTSKQTATEGFDLPERRIDVSCAD